MDIMCNANHLGRYVTVKDYGLWKLTICEIEVYATGNCYDSGCYNVAKGKVSRRLCDCVTHKTTCDAFLCSSVYTFVAMLSNTFITNFS